MDDCKHDGKVYTSGYASLWGPFGQFCALCGYCLSDPSFPARPEEAELVRRMDELKLPALPDWEAMTEEERAAQRADITRGVENLLKGMDNLLQPFRQPHNCVQRDDSFWTRSLD